MTEQSCDTCVYGEDDSILCLYPDYTINHEGECSDYLKRPHDFLDILQKLGLTTQAFFKGYDQQDKEWMLATKKHPPTAQQLMIAFSKYISGYRPGDELWSEEDQDAYLYSVGELS